MAARHRKCRTPDKVRYATRSDAMAVARKLPIIGHAYACRGHWHITSSPVRKPARRR